MERMEEPRTLRDIQEGVGRDLDLFGLGQVKRCFSCGISSQKERSAGCSSASLIQQVSQYLTSKFVLVNITIDS